MANKIQVRRGLKANLPTLDVGEPGFTTDTKQFYLGNGTENVEMLRKDVFDASIGKTNLKDNSNYLTVGATGAQFTTINAAIAYAKTYCSKTNRATIYVYPGTYNEEITLLDNPGIDIVGSGRDNTIVQYASIYPNAPIYTTGIGTFSNISFKSNGSDSYALHYDIGNSTVTGVTRFENCYFSSTGSAAGVGIGTGQDAEIILKNCTLNANAQPSLYFHNNPNSNKTNQHISIENCRLFGKTATNEYVAIDDACAIYGNTNSILYVSIINTHTDTSGKIRFRQVSGTMLTYIPYNNTNIILMNDCIGNNLVAINKATQRVVLGGFTCKPNFQAGGFTWYSLPCQDGNKYTWSVNNVTVNGVADITGSCTIDGNGDNYVTIKDSTTTGLGYSVTIGLIGIPK